MTLSGTLDPAQAARELWDVVVIGAGPSGATAARALARSGCRTLLVEKREFPRDKVCGDCLNAPALACLAAAGLGDLPDRLGGVVTTRFRITCAGGRLELPIPPGRAVSRGALDAALVEAAVASGTEFLPGATALLEAGSPAEPFRTLTLAESGRDTLRARVVVAADGLGHPSLRRTAEFPSRVAAGGRIGVGVRVTDPDAIAQLEPGMIAMAVGRDGYVGLVRVEDGSVNLAAALDPRAVRENGTPADVVAQILAEAGRTDVALPPPGAWRGTAALTRQTVRPAGRRVFLVGDAAAYVEPFTGEGIGWALASGLAVAPLALRGVAHWDPALEAEWPRTHRRLIGRRQAWCRTLAFLLRRPRLVRWGVRLAACVPVLCRPLVSRVNRPLRPQEVSPP